MKDRLNKKNWTLILTGSNSAGTAGITFHLTDNSAYETAYASPVGERYNVISGSGGDNNSLFGVNGNSTASLMVCIRPAVLNCAG